MPEPDPDRESEDEETDQGRDSEEDPGDPPSEDDYDQLTPEEEIDQQYFKTGGEISKAELVKDRYEDLLNMNPVAIAHFQKEGKLQKLQELMKRVEKWPDLPPDGVRYNRVKDAIYEELAFLDDCS